MEIELDADFVIRLDESLREVLDYGYDDIKEYESLLADEPSLAEGHIGEHLLILNELLSSDEWQKLVVLAAAAD